MNQLDLDHMRQRLDMALTAYIHAFERKHECEMDFAVCSDLLGVLCFGDEFFKIDDIIYDLENKLPKTMVHDWNDALIRQSFDMADEPHINLQSWHMGARYKNL